MKYIKVFLLSLFLALMISVPSFADFNFKYIENFINSSNELLSVPISETDYNSTYNTVYSKAQKAYRTNLFFNYNSHFVKQYIKSFVPSFDTSLDGYIVSLDPSDLTASYVFFKSSELYPWHRPVSGGYQVRLRGRAGVTSATYYNLTVYGNLGVSTSDVILNKYFNYSLAGSGSEYFTSGGSPSKIVLFSTDNSGFVSNGFLFFDDYFTYPSGSSHNTAPVNSGSGKLSIRLPRDGFKQSKLNAVSMLVDYTIPFDGNQSNVAINVTGYRSGAHDVTSHSFIDNGDGTAAGLLQVVGAVAWNIETELKVTVVDYQKNVYSKSVKVTCFDDFIDVDGDGKDDRTNKDEWTGNPDYGANPGGGGGVPFPTNGSILDILKWLGTSISDFFSNIDGMFKSLMSTGAGFVQFLTGSFKFIPSQILTLLGFAVAIAVALRIFGR